MSGSEDGTLGSDRVDDGATSTPPLADEQGVDVQAVGGEQHRVLPDVLEKERDARRRSQLKNTHPLLTYSLGFAASADHRSGATS